MSTDQNRRERINQRIAESQARLRRSDSKQAAAPAQKAPTPTGGLPGVMRDHPWLTVAAGLGMGALVAAALPRRAGSRLSRRAIGIAAIAAEAAITLSKQAGDLADEKSAPLRKSAGRAATTLSSSARSATAGLAGEIIRIFGRLKG